jgi:uncharacterized protein (TIGR03067 family)
MRLQALFVLLVGLLLAADKPREDAVKKELAKFQGSWQAVAVQHADGQPGPADEVRQTRLVVEGTKFTLTGKGYSIAGTFTIDPTRTPKAIDVLVTPNDGPKVRFPGIYAVQGDKRKSCFALSGKERPKRFSSGEGLFGFEWKRD